VDGEGKVHEVRVGGSLHANSGDALCAAAIAGLGIVCEPDFMVGDAPLLPAGSSACCPGSTRCKPISGRFIQADVTCR